MKHIPIPLQMYTLREEFTKDVADTFKKAEIGYTNIELAGNYGFTFKKMKAVLDKLEIGAISNDTAPISKTIIRHKETLENLKP